MAVVWRKQVKGSIYEIRTAGNSIRLYTDGIFHSQWNPNHSIGGNIWELLFIPALFVDPSSVRRVLVLGVGGGAVINLLGRFIQPSEVIGVDLDEIHLKLARRYFGVKSGKVKLVRSEAVAWAERYSGQPFDLVIEDLFVSDGNGEPVRAVMADRDWLRQLQNLLVPSGLLVMNHESSRQVKSTARTARREGLFANAVQLKTDNYDNAIGVFSNCELNHGILDTRLSGFRQLDRRYKSCKLKFSLRRI